MPKTKTIRARVELRLKRDAEAMLKKDGLVPNKESRRAIHDAKNRRGLETFESVSDWAKKMRTL